MKKNLGIGLIAIGITAFWACLHLIIPPCIVKRLIEVSSCVISGGIIIGIIIGTIFFYGGKRNGKETSENN